jgi:hypothetical protein
LGVDPLGVGGDDLVECGFGVSHSGIGLAPFGFIIEVVHAIEVFRPSGWLALALSKCPALPRRGCHNDI